MADKKRNILEFVEQSNFEQFTPIRLELTVMKKWFWGSSLIKFAQKHLNFLST